MGTHRRPIRKQTTNLGDEGVLLDGVLVQALEVALLDVTAVALLAAGDEVVAEVELVIGVPARVAGQGTKASLGQERCGAHLQACKLSCMHGA